MGHRASASPRKPTFEHCAFFIGDLHRSIAIANSYVFGPTRDDPGSIPAVFFLFFFVPSTG
jgi:hypothetical protein